MLKHTFCHLHGVGTKTEKRLWQAGFHSWDQLCEAKKPPVRSLPRALLKAQLEESARHYAAGDIAYFANKLPIGEHWRLLWDCIDAIAYVDIETTGLHESSLITSIALYDGKQARTYIRGQNLHDFVDAIATSKLIVTYNGRCFDVPFIERQLHVTLPKAHIDLRYFLRSLGYKGGLKQVEKDMGIGRHSLDGVDGAFAITLWRAYERHNDLRALQTLQAYNVADVLSLEVLLKRGCNESLQDSIFAPEYRFAEQKMALNPYTPDVQLIQKLMSSAQ